MRYAQESVVLPEQQYLSTCPACGEQIDVTSLEPYVKISCPSCRESVRVRRKFDHFMIIKQIGEGGMSRVFEAEDETLGRRVALKILNRKYSGDLVRMAQFQQEALTTARVTHPNVIKLYSVGFDQGHFFIAMELVNGGSLEQRIKREGRVSEKEVLRIGRQVAEGLRAAHRMGLLHRDVKPANILFTDDGTAKVVDFGLALFVQQKDQSGEIWATPYYVSPEKVIENKEDFRSDLFSLGASLYHALTGQPPHKVKSASLHELRMVKCRRVSLEDTGIPLGTRTVHVVDALVAYNPDERPSSYDEAVEELRLAEGLTDRPFIGLASRRRKIAAVAAVALILAFIAGLWVRSTAEQDVTDGMSDQQALNSLSGAVVTLEEGAQSKSERFLEARRLLASGDATRARPLYEGLLSEGVRHPTMNWARFGGALCAVMEKDQRRAKALFNDLALDPGGSGTDGVFFKTTGDLQRAALGVQVKSGELKFDEKTEDVLTPLSVGLAQWYFGKPEEATAHLRQFLEAIRSGHRVGWITDFRQLAEMHVRDANLVLPLLNQPKVPTPAEIPSVVAAMEQVLSELNTNGKLKEVLQSRIAKMRETLVKTEQRGGGSKVKELLQRRQRELAQLTELIESLPSLVRGYNYDSVIRLLKEIQFESPEVRAALEGRLYLYESAAAFLDQWCADVSGGNWTGTLQRRDAAPITGTILKADLSELRIRLERGELTIPLGSISPDALLKVASEVGDGISDSTDFYRRQELIAAFAKVTGQEELAATISSMLMEEDRGFRARWMKVLQGGI
jgi:eukaryotic-like serine/threonine-protein kinase